jgi:hypothetical protein
MPLFLKKPSPFYRKTNTPATSTKHPQVKDLSVPATSTSAIALPIAPPSCDPTDIAPDEPESSKESRWATTYEAAKMVIEIANASSDMFLPLKAVVGALSVLIKNYDVRFPHHLVRFGVDRCLQQTADNADRIKEIEERVDSLREILASPVGDQDDEEKVRRDALRKSVILPFDESPAHL